SAFSAQSLQAMAAYLGGALENAQLFLEIKDAYQSLQTAQDQLVHSEKFAAVGHLSAQIAHEINNPASFVISNLSVMMDYVTSMRGFVTELDRVASTHLPALAPHLAKALDAHDIEYLRDDLDVLLERSLAGMQRIHQIVQDLRYFAYDAGPEPGWVDLEAIIDASISLIRHELRHRARVERDFEAAPEVYSDANKLSQVFLNLLVNASQALEYGSPEDDYVRVGTMSVGDNVLIYMEDTGQGIAPEHLGRIFEPFFTTKERGQGTGLGLSISRDILRSLGGDIRVYSRPGEGTRFEVLLPVRAPGAPASIDTFVPL
ncbi:MAG: ATP-binding protein, partial [Myxococcota bacterium]